MLALALAFNASAGHALPPRRPPLAVVLVVDQLRADYLDRWGSEWTGGFRRFREHGLFFSAGQQDHAITQTAPGHASILTGRFPANTGIVANQFGVPDSAATLVGAAGPGASPRRLRGTTLLDWMRAADSGVRFLSVSVKDRSAILTAGRSRGAVFWLAAGRFTTSRYYADTLPAWVVRFDSLMPRPLDQSAHDSVTLALALAGQSALGLGRRAGTDLMIVALSATDEIGHEVGPEGAALHEHLRHLDRWLGSFLDSLARVTGASPLVVLTADHGVTPIPEETRRGGRSAGRIDLGPTLKAANRALEVSGVRGLVIRSTSGLVYADSAGLERAGVDRESLATDLAGRVGTLPGVARAYTPATLAAAPPGDIQATRWRHSLSTGFPWLVGASAAPGYIWSEGGSGTTHGTGNPDDVLVPIVFLGPGVRAARVTRPVRTVDIAPTLAGLLGVTPSERLDGVPLVELAGRRR
jgi:arylsulfatase A-like enzyme